jgi:hypothetical protein
MFIQAAGYGVLTPVPDACLLLCFVLQLDETPPDAAADSEVTLDTVAAATAAP